MEWEEAAVESTAMGLTSANTKTSWSPVDKPRSRPCIARAHTQHACVPGPVGESILETPQARGNEKSPQVAMNRVVRISRSVTRPTGLEGPEIDESYWKSLEYLYRR